MQNQQQQSSTPRKQVIKIAEPAKFSGKRDIAFVDAWLLSMERYLEHYQVGPRNWVTTTGKRKDLIIIINNNRNVDNNDRNTQLLNMLLDKLTIDPPAVNKNDDLIDLSSSRDEDNSDGV